jgi:hypothetical protein
MSERKSINKYYPPNFDPRKVPPVQRKLDNRDPSRGVTFTVRLMSPFSMQCLSCGEFIHKGRKFNARKETVVGQDYLGIKLHRFNIRCPVCASEIVFRTDPKTDDYVCEKGAKRNSEPWRDRVREKEARSERLKRLEELGGADDPLRELERKAYDAKKEIEVSESLDNLRTARARIDRVDPEAVISALRYSANPFDGIPSSEAGVSSAGALHPDDEELVRQAFPRSSTRPSLPASLGDCSSRAPPLEPPGGRTSNDRISLKRSLLGIVPRKKPQ